jgi:hypothetical protein
MMTPSGAGGTDEREHPGPRLALEVTVDERLHRGEIEGGTEPPDDGPENDDRCQALGEHHRKRPDEVEEQPDDVGALAAEEVAELAADEDECRGHKRLDRHRRLNAAHRGVEIANHGGNRDVHERRVDHEDEHRRREECAE